MRSFRPTFLAWCALFTGLVAALPAQAQLSVEILVNGTEDPTDDYVTWAPTRCPASTPGCSGPRGHRRSRGR